MVLAWRSAVRQKHRNCIPQMTLFPLSFFLSGADMSLSLAHTHEGDMEQDGTRLASSHLSSLRLSTMGVGSHIERTRGMHHYDAATLSD